MRRSPASSLAVADPKAEMVMVMVIARYASHPMAGNAVNDPVMPPMYMAVAKALMK